MWQQALIVPVVLAASGYVTWTFASMQLRQRLLDALAARGILVNVARRHRARLSVPGCSNCSANGEQPSHARPQKH
jgi:hypothetical protein